MTSENSDLKLFEIGSRVPDGFVYRENFVSESEEIALIREIAQVELAQFRYYQFTGRRRTVSFGWQYEFGQSGITPAPDIPGFLLPLQQRAGKLFGIEPAALAQASILEYAVGAPIGWHRDVPYFGVVVGISLASVCRMRFRKFQRGSSRRSKRDEVLAIELKPRSIYLMSGAARESWQHSIPPVKALRYAIMMRTLRSQTAR